MRKLAIAYGRSSRSKKWSNKETDFGALCDRLKTTKRTCETVEEYSKMDSTLRQMVKDHGSFVCGALAEGRRLMQNVVFRSMLSLDDDEATSEFVSGYKARMKYSSCLYTTHGHTPDSPRVRIIVPLKRNVTPEEFVALSRHLAGEFGIDMFDECSYVVNQMMYWQSTPKDGEFLHIVTDGEWLNPDAVFTAHPELKDSTKLPTSSRESAVRANLGKK